LALPRRDPEPGGRQIGQHGALAAASLGGVERLVRLLQQAVERRAPRERIWQVYAPAIETMVGRRLSDGDAQRLAALLGKLAD
jgi:hypothetical protein